MPILPWWDCPSVMHSEKRVPTTFIMHVTDWPKKDWQPILGAILTILNSPWRYTKCSHKQVRYDRTHWLDSWQSVIVETRIEDMAKWRA